MSRDQKSKHYDAGGIETIDIIKAKLTPEQFRGYLLGNTIKYACRLNFKGSASRDAEKCANYSKWLADCKGKDIDVECACQCDLDYIAKIGTKHHG